MLDEELRTEPDRIRAVYEVKATRMEPVGAGVPLANDRTVDSG